MAVTYKHLICSLLVLVLMNFVFVETEARDPFNIMQSGNSAKRAFQGFFDGLSLGAIKESGPSPGAGHKFTDGHTLAKTLGGIKQSGPSPSEGHSYVTGNRH